MFRSDLNPRDRGGAIAAVIGIHAALLFAFLHLSGRVDLANPQEVLRVFNIKEVPTPPPVQPKLPKPAEQSRKAKEKEGAAAPKNVRSQATPVVAPKPRIEPLVPPPIAVTQTPNQGAAPTQGASTPGPGTGAGGTGTGTGAGGAGSGTGGGGEGIATRARLLTPSLRSRDYPPELRRRLDQGAAPFVMFTVLPTGRVTGCRIYQSSGDPEIDDMTCRLVTARFVYRPAYNRRGEPVASQMAYRQAQ